MKDNIISTADSIIKDINSKIYSPIYLLMGKEPYFIDVITQALLNNVLTEAEKDFNQSIIYGKDIDVYELLTMARRAPMMSNYQLIVVKEAQQLNKIEELDSYLKNYLKSTILVLNYKYESLDKRSEKKKTFLKNVSQKGILFESTELYDSQIPDWIIKNVKEQGYQIQKHIAIMLSEFLGNDLTKINNELTKLFLNLKKGDDIPEKLILSNIGISKEYNIFEFQKALASKDIIKVNKIVNYFISNPKENPLIKIINFLYGFYSKTLTYRYYIDVKEKDISSKMKMQQWMLKDYTEAASKNSYNKLASVISIIKEYDLRSKGVNNNSTDSGELLKEMIFKILH
ncbi:MAG: DNA polymerase III subunit delta [Bacteroidetes bacterium GWE2_29_8]|nr:MAG: DNA polymerase III subunit delta [Bacteroidetes bacterium GWE2_29_8]OFY16185.1 MAG: DNA polymerase III subunit delta [Bacteroidetes bacterium GWF2_29_10]